MSLVSLCPTGSASVTPVQSSKGSRLVRRIWTGSHISLTRCHSTLADLHTVSLFLPVRTFLKYFTAPESCARLFSPKYSSIFIPLVHNALIFNLISVSLQRMLPGYIPDYISVFRLQYFTSLTLTITKSPRDLQPC